jgi:hypothetical protein
MPATEYMRHEHAMPAPFRDARGQHSKDGSLRAVGARGLAPIAPQTQIEAALVSPRITSSPCLRPSSARARCSESVAFDRLAACVCVPKDCAGSEESEARNNLRSKAARASGRVVVRQATRVTSPCRVARRAANLLEIAHEAVLGYETQQARSNRHLRGARSTTRARCMRCGRQTRVCVRTAAAPASPWRSMTERYFCVQPMAAP